jgi:hypothetical protein
MTEPKFEYNETKTYYATCPYCGKRLTEDSVDILETVWNMHVSVCVADPQRRLCPSCSKLRKKCVVGCRHYSEGQRIVKLCIGNPCDDWQCLPRLNKYMEEP